MCSQCSQKAYILYVEVSLFEEDSVLPVFPESLHIICRSVLVWGRQCVASVPRKPAYYMYKCPCLRKTVCSQCSQKAYILYVEVSLFEEDSVLPVFPESLHIICRSVLVWGRQCVASVSQKACILYV